MMGHVKISRMVLVAAVLATSACRDEVVAPVGAELLPGMEELGPGIHPVLAIPGLGTAPLAQVTRVRVHLVEVAQEQRLASWQGLLRYDPEALEVVDGAFGEGLVGAWHLVEPGVVRFAGIALEGLRGAAAVDLTVRALRAPVASDFDVILEEVVGVEGFQDLTTRVVKGQRTKVVGRELGEFAR